MKRNRCGSCNTRIRRHRVKQAAVSYLGSKCIDCGWEGLYTGFDFHHRDPKYKKFNIGTIANKSWEIVKKELDKCDLLCSLCHRLRCFNKTEKENKRFFEELKKYKGRLFI